MTHGEICVAHSVPRVKLQFNQLELKVGLMMTHGMMPLDRKVMVGGLSG